MPNVERRTELLVRFCLRSIHSSGTNSEANATQIKIFANVQISHLPSDPLPKTGFGTHKHTNQKEPGCSDARASRCEQSAGQDDRT